MLYLFIHIQDLEKEVLSAIFFTILVCFHERLIQLEVQTAIAEKQFRYAACLWLYYEQISQCIVFQWVRELRTTSAEDQEAPAILCEVGIEQRKVNAYLGHKFGNL